MKIPKPFFAIDNTDIKIDTQTSTSWDSNGSISTRRHRLNVPLYEDINVSEPAKKSLKATGSYFAETSEDRLQYYRT